MGTTSARYAMLLTACLAALCSGGITIESPNGGERIPAKSQWTIAWRCDGTIQQVTIEFSFTNGVFWEPVTPAAACAKGKGSYFWAVPSVSSPQCLIRITDAGKSVASGQSDAVFTIFPCALRMDYDNDCVVTFADLAAFAREWLRCGDPYDPACLGNSPPRIVSSPPSQVNPGQAYIYNVKATDPDGDELTYELLRAPSGMVIDPASGRIVWNPMVEQKDGPAVIVQVRDEFGAADVQAFELGDTEVRQTFTGAPANGYPSLFERRVIVYTNAVRMAPQQYRDKYMAGFKPSPTSILRSHVAGEPVYYNPSLNQSARSHAQDMAENGCFQHDNCDGTLWSDRIRSFYPQAQSMGENIALGYPTAKQLVDSWLCDEAGGQCAPDGTWSAGHRANIMDRNLRQVGTGYTLDPADPRRHYWVEDFASNEPADTPPLVAGCHDFLISGKTSFLLNYRDTGNLPPASVKVVVNGIAYDMSLDLGSAAAGTYRLDLSKAGSCREYYFVATTGSGAVWRYPGPGVFLTDGEGTCSGDYR